MRREEAEQQLEQARVNINAGLKFCPLIKRECKGGECMAWSAGEIHEFNSDPWSNLPESKPSYGYSLPKCTYFDREID